MFVWTRKIFRRSSGRMLNECPPGKEWRFAFGYLGIVGAVMNPWFGEPFGEIDVVKGLRYQNSSRS